MHGPYLPSASLSAQIRQPHGQGVGVVMGMVAAVVGMTARVGWVVFIMTVTMIVVPCPGVSVVKR
jgi:hypothetical protein